MLNNYKNGVAMYTYDMHVTLVSDAVMMSSQNLSHPAILRKETYSVTHLS